ncbi:hypothetical protein D3C72_1925040 [compost metagenome]
MQMAGVIQDMATRVIANLPQKALKGHTVMQILPWVQFIAKVDTDVVKSIEDRPPTLCQLPEGFLQQQRIVRWPGVKIGPGQRARKSHVCG